MNIRVNGQIRAVSWLEPTMPLAKVIEQLMDELEVDGRVIMEVVVDGTRHAVEDLEAFSGKVVQDVGLIEVVLQSHMEILSQAIHDAPTILAELEERSAKGASELRIGKTREGMENLLDLVDGMEWLSTVLDHLGKTGHGLTESGAEAQRQKLVTHIQEQLKTVQQAQEQQDWVGVADILEYEIPDIFKESASFIRSLKI